MLYRQNLQSFAILLNDQRFCSLKIHASGSESMLQTNPNNYSNARSWFLNMNSLLRVERMSFYLHWLTVKNDQEKKHGPNIVRQVEVYEGASLNRTTENEEVEQHKNLSKKQQSHQH